MSEQETNRPLRDWGADDGDELTPPPLPAAPDYPRVRLLSPVAAPEPVREEPPDLPGGAGPADFEDGFDTEAPGRDVLDREPEPRYGPEDDEWPVAESPEPDEEPYGADDLADEDEPFNLPGTEKLGIIGGKGVGKSYLFQAMVYRTFSGPQSGALNYYLDGIRLFYALKRGEKARTLNLSKFIKKYSSWERLPFTTFSAQMWYRLRLRYRTGLVGSSRAAMDVEFFDGSGEGFFQANRTTENRKLWREGYLDARVMVFCLPLWAAFPSSGMSAEDWKSRDDLLEGFEQVVQNYTDLRTLNKRTTPVKSILALTMADDRRSALSVLHDKWISPYIDSPHTYLRQLKSGAGISRYLANARRISEAMHAEFEASRDPRVSSIPQSLDFGGRPWMIPVCAIEGGRLEQVEREYPLPENRPALQAPVPAHVELPLLVALCERDNALM